MPENEGGVITMTIEDHMKTGSWDSKNRDYLEKQKKLLDEGKFQEALEMDFKDIRNKFGYKYDESINDMIKYYKSIGIVK